MLHEPAQLLPIELFDPARHAVEHFRSGVPSLDMWLRSSAGTWVLPRSTQVVGYYSLAMGGLKRDGIPTRLGRGHPDPIPILLLARLALDKHEQGRGIGAELLSDALRRAVVGAWHYGARALVVDAVDERAFGFYRHHGFLPLAGPRLYRRISEIARSLSA